jgi:hypothetical protein
MGFTESIFDERLKALYASWRRKRGVRPMPGRSDIDPAEMRPWLPHLILLDVIDGGREFRYRLVGTEIERQIGRALTGRLVGEVLEADYLAYILGLHRRVVAEAAPVYAENSFGDERQGFAIVAPHKRAYRLSLPLSKTGTAIDMLLCGQIFDLNRLNAGPDVLLVDR